MGLLSTAAGGRNLSPGHVAMEAFRLWTGTAGVRVGGVATTRLLADCRTKAQNGAAIPMFVCANRSDCRVTALSPGEDTQAH
jgi:hypothetical protein